MAEQFSDGYLMGQLLVAMPTMRDPRFTRSVIFICAHSADGAMGLVVNRLVGSLTFPDLLAQLGIDRTGAGRDIRVHFGGPVETGRGFVLHSPDYSDDGTMMIGDRVGLTASIDILRDVAAGGGPRQSLLALGYAGWGPGQLDEEMQNNVWLSAPAELDVIFDGDHNTKWQRALAKLHVDPLLLSSTSGRA